MIDIKMEVRSLLSLQRTIDSKIHNAVEEIMRGYPSGDIIPNAFESIKYSLDEAIRFFDR